MISSIINILTEKPLLKTLIVEDDPYLSQSLERAIRSMAGRDTLLQLDWYTEGKAGIAALARGPYDIVIADFCLPSTETGAEVVAYAQNSASRPLCVMMSGLPLPELELRLKTLNIHVPILHKPFSISDVTTVLESAVLSTISAKKAGF